MIDIIKNLFHTKPKLAVKIIKNTPELSDWVEANCDPNCINFKSKIYTAVTGEKILCPCGSGKLRGYITYSAGLSFCGRAGTCSAAREAVSKNCINAAKNWDKELAKTKRAATNKQKYGVENIGQTALAKSTRAAIYEDPAQVAAILEKMKSTNQERYGMDSPASLRTVQNKRKLTNIQKYGAEHPAQNQTIKHKTKQTNISRYGTEYTVNAPVIREKIKKTNLERYNAEYALSSKNIREKIENTNLERYGFSSTLATPKIREKNLAIIKEKYGFMYPAQNTVIMQKTKVTNQIKYNTNFSAQRLYSDQTKEILFDRDKFSDNLLKYGVAGLSQKLKICATTILNYHHRYKLNIITSSSSSYESEIINWLTTLGVRTQKDRTICKPKEIDIYMPDHKLAIEFDGLYWHSEKGGSKTKDYHSTKTQQCANQGIQLIHIFEDEWVNNKEICQSIIAGYLNIPAQVIPARKCTIEIVSNKELREFLMKNHLQGYAAASVNLVLKYNNEIIAAMTFGKSRYNKKIEWELLRLVTKCHVRVVGGTARLWQYFVKTYSPNSIVSYCDKRWFTGGIYEKLGMTKIQCGKPGYWYTDYETRCHRSRFTKKKAVDSALICESNTLSQLELMEMTEKQITGEVLGLDRIWDCGQDTWIWKIIK